MQRRLQIIHTFRALCFFVLLLSLFFPLTYRWPYNLICRLKCSFLNNTQSLPPCSPPHPPKKKGYANSVHQSLLAILIPSHCFVVYFSSSWWEILIVMDAVGYSGSPDEFLDFDTLCSEKFFGSSKPLFWDVVPRILWLRRQYDCNGAVVQFICYWR